MNILKPGFVAAIAILASSTSLISQQIDPDRIVVIGSASIEIPADIVNVRITLSFQDKVDGKSAYARHKDTEARFIQFLHEMNIPDSVINFTPLSISAQNDYSRRDSVVKIYNTNQLVTVRIFDLSKYADFQLKLISNGFTTFSETFESSKSREAEDEAIKKAVLKARAKAELMASAAGRKILRVAKISDTEETEPVIARYREPFHGTVSAQTAFSSASRLMDLPQTISVEKQVKVVFDLAK
jgi:hypothetical protein